MEIRELREDEREAAHYLGSQAFRFGNRDTSILDHPDRRPRSTYGVWDDAGLQAMVGVIPFEIHFGPDAIVSMGGIAAVASLPASRGRGYATECLKYSLERMREQGQVVSTLFPFSFDYYDRTGWAWTGVTRTYEAPTRILRASPETEYVRAATDLDRDAIRAAYAEFARGYRGLVVRDDKLWNQVLNSSEKQFRYTYLYERDGHTEGYVTYMGGKREKTEIREFIALTPRALRGLLGLLRRHEMQIDKFSWEAPADDPLWSFLYHWDLETRLAPTTQARIVDVPAALAAWRPAHQRRGSVVVAVSDKTAPWNQGSWRIDFAEGHVEAKAADIAPQVTLDIRELSQAYFGTPSVAEIRAADGMTVHDETGYKALADLLAGPQMWMNDSF